MSTTKPTVGVLAPQGGIAERLAALERCGATAKRVRRPEELAEVHGLVLPGGESAAMSVRALATLSDGGPHVRAGHNTTGRIVAVQQGPVFATAFHPELVRGDERMHRYFVQTVRAH